MAKTVKIEKVSNGFVLQMDDILRGEGNREIVGDSVELMCKIGNFLNLRLTIHAIEQPIDKDSNMKKLIEICDNLELDVYKHEEDGEFDVRAVRKEGIESLPNNDVLRDMVKTGKRLGFDVRVYGESDFKAIKLSNKEVLYAIKNKDNVKCKVCDDIHYYMSQDCKVIKGSKKTIEKHYSSLGEIVVYKGEENKYGNYIR